MPLDPSIPLQIQTPNPIGMMGNLVNTAQGVQNLQTGAIQQQRLGINLQSEAQANQERQNVIQAVQSDPDFKPGADGIIDTAKVMPKLMQLAPQTYNQYAQNISTSNGNATTVNKQLMDLGQDKIKSLGETVTSKVGRPASEVADAVDQWAEANPQGRKVADLFISTLGKADTQDKVDAVTKGAALRANAISSQLEATTPSVSLVQQGPQAQGVVTASKLSGQPLMAPVGKPVPMGAAPGYQVDAAGNLVQVPGFMPGRGGPTQAAPQTGPGATVPPAPPWMNKQTAQNASDAQARWSSAQTRDVDPASGYNATAQVYSNLKSLLDKNPNIGPGSAGWNQLLGRIGTYSGHAVDPNSDYQQVAGYLDRISAINSAATGAATNFAREQQASATGNPEVMGPEAIKEKLRFGASVNEASHAYATASRAFLTKQGAGAAYANPQLFEGAWSSNADPVAFRLMAANRDGDKADFAATQARVAAMPPDQQQAIHQHYLNLKNYLLKGQLPPNG